MCVFVFDLDLGRRHFRGQAAVEAAVTSLVREHGLGSHPGHTLVFGGDSAGGIGSMLHIDAMPALLDRLGAAASVRLLGLADSSYLIDDECGIDSLGMLHGRPLPRPGGAGRPGEVPQVVWPDGCRMNVPTRSGLADDVSPGHFPGYSGYVQGLLQLANVDDDDGSFLSRECLRRYRRGTSSGGGGGGGSSVDEGWKCGLAEYQMPFVRARYLMVSSMADSYQLTNNLGHRPATDLELEYARRFALRSSDAARELLLPDGYGGGDHGGDGPSMVFMQNCYSHGAILPPEVLLLLRVGAELARAQPPPPPPPLLRRRRVRLRGRIYRAGLWRIRWPHLSAWGTVRGRGIVGGGCLQGGCLTTL